VRDRIPGGLPILDRQQDPLPVPLDAHDLARHDLIEQAEPILARLGGGDSFHAYNVHVECRSSQVQTKGTQRATILAVRTIAWSPEKNEALKADRAISFEDVVFHILVGDIVETYEHPNQERYPGQRIHAIAIEGYVYLVPFVETEDEVFLKTIIPSRRPQRDTWEQKMSRLDQEEQEVLEAFEAGKLEPSTDAMDVQKRHREYAEALLRKDARINIRLSSKDLRGLQKRALAEGIPYQTLIASVLHKYVEGRLREHGG